MFCLCPYLSMFFSCTFFKSKCHQYWPKKLGEKLHVGFGITLRMDETVPFADYNITKLTLINVSKMCKSLQVELCLFE